MNNENMNTQYQPPQYQPGYPSGYQPNSQPPNKPDGMKLSVLIAIIIAAIVLLSIISILIVQNTRIGKAQHEKLIREETLMDSLMDYSQYANMESERKLVVNGTAVNLPQHMLNINNNSYISLEGFSEVFGYEFQMDAHNKKTTVKSPSRSVDFMQGVQNVTVTENGNTWDVDMGDGNTVYMFDNGTTYVPLRPMKEVFGFKSVDWDDSTSSVKIETEN